MVRRVYVEKKPGQRQEAEALLRELRTVLGVSSLTELRALNRYDVEGMDEDTFRRAVRTVFSEPQVDNAWETLPPVFIREGGLMLAVEALPGQFDQRSDSAASCIQLMTQGERPRVRAAKVYFLMGELTMDDWLKIRGYLINPVERREARLDRPDTLELPWTPPAMVETVTGFTALDAAGLSALLDSMGLAMDLDDLRCLQAYFRDTEARDPTVTELRVVDTYWSDHCRHTTFSTRLDRADIADSRVQAAYDRYLSLREEVYGAGVNGSGADRSDVNGAGTDAPRRPQTLMDIATIGAKALKKRGVLKNLDESEEINACSVRVTATVDGENQDWLLMFKNETHNHPTEIEPFGGAATCIGGCIRDPLSGRAYVHQAMRLTGCGDPRVPVGETLPGKLPQRKIAQTAAAGYSSYGNQIGLATGLVSELYHPGYVAKHMEVGAVLAAAPAEAVVRKRPEPGDVVILLGGRTGRDGIGGATGASKSHDSKSLTTMASEVQKGNAPEERKIQRLFRDGNVTRLIKRCNDFGAGGVSVAVGELADGLEIDLDAVRKKYEGLDGTELAISESQERMAVVVAPEDAAAFMDAAERENLEAYPVAKVTAEARMVMRWQGQTIVSLSRAFLNTNGAEKHITVNVPDFTAQTDTNGSDTAEAGAKDAEADTKGAEAAKKDAKTHRISADADRTESGTETDTNKTDSAPWTLRDVASCLDCASRRGLAERFDSTVGAGSILMPFGGKYQRTPAQSMAALLPVLPGQETEDGSVMAWGFDPRRMAADPYRGAWESVAVSLAKLVSAGADYRAAYLTFQEYFEKLGQDPRRWGKPFSALLGALDAQMELGAAAIGGKDSMSGSFLDMDVPPTLISFAIAPVKARAVVSPEFKGTGHPVCLFGYGAGDGASLRRAWEAVQELCAQGKVRAAWAVEHSVAEAVMKMSFGNRIGFRADGPFRLDRMAKAAEQAAKAAEQAVKTVGGADGASGVSPADAPAAGFSWFAPMPGAIVAELPVDANPKAFGAVRLGLTIAEEEVDLGGDRASIAELLSLNEGVLADVYPVSAPAEETEIPAWEPLHYWKRKAPSHVRTGLALPRVLIPVFPGTNCEYDSQRSVLRAGLDAETFVVNNQTARSVAQSADLFAAAVRRSQIVFIPGGFSGGDEPDGSGKFITAFFRSPQVSEAVTDLLDRRGGLMLGICNGFQALIKLGLVPYGKITDPEEDAPTLTFNTIGRHQSRIVRTRVASVRSPWLGKVKVGSVVNVPISHGEGRFLCPPDLLRRLAENGQIATQYADYDGAASMDPDSNPNGSVWAVEGLLSPDGRVFGKMGHAERVGPYLYRNVPGNYDLGLFEAAREYFS